MSTERADPGLSERGFPELDIPCCKRIMVTLDGSHRAEGVVPFAARLAYMMDAQIELVTVSDKSGATMHDIDQDSYRSIGETDSFLTTWFKKVEKTILTGEPAEQIVAHAHESNADMIAMATHGRTGLMRRLMGSVTATVLETASVPVLVIRSENVPGLSREERHLKTVIVPLDGSALSETAVRHATAIADALAAKVIVLHVAEGSDVDVVTQDILDGVESNMQKSDIEATVEVASGDAKEMITKKIEATPESLVVICSRGATGDQSRAPGSVADHIIRHSSAPVVVVPPW